MMNGMPIQYLNGTETVRLGDEFDGLGDIHPRLEGEHFKRDFLRRHKHQLRQTRNLIHRDPHRFKKIYNVHRLGEMYDQLLGAWDDDSQRNAMLNHLSGIEEEALRPELQGLGNVIHGSDDELFGEIINADFSADGLGRHKFFGGGRLRDKVNNFKKRSTGVFTKIKNAHKKVFDKVKKVTKDGLDKIKKGLKKFNPAIVAIRAAFLVAMKTNAGRIASRAYWGYFSKAEAMSAGVTASYWQKAVIAVQQLQKIFVEKLSGDASTLRKAIVSGRASKRIAKGKLSGFDQLLGLGSLGWLGDDDAPATDDTSSDSTATDSTDTTSTDNSDSGNDQVQTDDGDTKKGGFAKLFGKIAAFFKKLFHRKKGGEETETGGTTTPPTGMKDTSTGPIVLKDKAVAVYKNLVDNSGGSASTPDASNADAPTSTSDDSTSDNSDGNANPDVQAGEGKDVRVGQGKGDGNANTDPHDVNTNPDLIDINSGNNPNNAGTGSGVMGMLLLAAGAALALKAASNHKGKKGAEKKENPTKPVGSTKKHTAKKTIKKVELT